MFFISDDNFMYTFYFNIVSKSLLRRVGKTNKQLM